VPAWGTAVLASAIAAAVSFVLSLVLSWARERAERQRKRNLLKRKTGRIVRRDFGLIDDCYLGRVEEEDLVRDLCSRELDELIITSEELWPELSEALAAYRDTLLAFRRVHPIIFAKDTDPKCAADPVVEAAHKVLDIAGLQRVNLEPWEAPGASPTS